MNEYPVTIRYVDSTNTNQQLFITVKANNRTDATIAGAGKAFALFANDPDNTLFAVTTGTASDSIPESDSTEENTDDNTGDNTSGNSGVE